jgi:hypothetical protein
MNRIRRNIGLAGLTGASIVAMSVGFAEPRAMAASAGSAAAVTCFDFSTLPLNFQYRIGDVVQTQIGPVELKHYVLNGNKIENAAAQAYAVNSQIAGGPSPELRTYLINSHFTPNVPASAIDINFGHLGPVNSKHANLGVNGELVEVTTTLADLNGRILGDPALGQVLVTVNITNGAGTTHETGTIHFEALNGSIVKTSEGGVQLFLDNFCTTF